MTDTVHSLTVVLDHDIRVDDVSVLKQAILCLKGVVAVEANVADPTSWMAEERAKQELKNRLWETLK